MSVLALEVDPTGVSAVVGDRRGHRPLGGDAEPAPEALWQAVLGAAIASMACCASGPTAETTIDVPGPAANIISPMMDVPPTVSPLRVTQTSALNRSTI